MKREYVTVRHFWPGPGSLAGTLWHNHPALPGMPFLILGHHEDLSQGAFVCLCSRFAVRCQHHRKLQAAHSVPFLGFATRLALWASRFCGTITDMHIRRACPDDAPAIWRIIGPTIRAGETYALDPDMTEAAALAYWLGNDRETFVAEEDGEIVGTYYIRPNQAGGGRHICNCGYMTSAAATGCGVARAMCQHSLDYARQSGYRGMQFNFVVSTNTRAVSLWQSFGFDIVGRLRQAFHHPTLGYVDALVMFLAL